MEITTKIEEVLVSQIEEFLQPVIEIRNKEKERCMKLVVNAGCECDEKMDSLAIQADKTFRAWFSKKYPGCDVHPSYCNDSLVFSHRNGGAFNFKTMSASKYDDAYHKLYKRLKSAVIRTASEQPSKTAYTEVDKLLISIDPVAEYNKILKDYN